MFILVRNLGDTEESIPADSRRPLPGDKIIMLPSPDGKTPYLNSHFTVFDYRFHRTPFGFQQSIFKSYSQNIIFHWAFGTRRRRKMSEFI